LIPESALTVKGYAKLPLFWSAAHTTFPLASVVSFPPFPNPEQAEEPRVERVSPPFARMRPPATVEVAAVLKVLR
jgi:hypothetical protein